MGSAPSNTATMPAFRRTGLTLRELASRAVRQRIPTAGLVLLLVLGVLPLFVCLLRVLAVVGAAPGGVTWFWTVGDWLNESLSLLWIPPADRAGVLYILLLPLAALLTALTRLTLGIRVLGFRAILIAIGFQEIGLVPSLLLIGVVALAVVAVRPAMRRFGLPLYARVAAILCIVAVTMVGGLLAGAWLGSATLWSFAFFPVVILAMLAESIADTVARDNAAMAAWRTSSTILLAAIIAGFSQITLLRELVLACPELIVTQLVLVVMVAELLDWRLFESFHPGAGQHSVSAARGSVAVVRNRWAGGVLLRRGVQAPQRYRRRSLQPLVDALRDLGYRVKVLEGDLSLPTELKRFFPAQPQAPDALRLVVNCSPGLQGRGRLCQVVALCELAGVTCSGPDALAMAVLNDRRQTLQVLQAAGIPTPEWADADSAADWLPGRQFPLQVRARFQPDRPPLRVDDADALDAAVRQIEKEFGDPMLETAGTGRRLRAVMLASPEPGEAMQCLPLVEWRPRDRRYRPARGRSDAALAGAQTLASNAARALRCRDTVRIDLRLSADGRVLVEGVRAVDLLSPRGCVASAAQLAGIDYPALVARLADALACRARAEPC